MIDYFMRRYYACAIEVCAWWPEMEVINGEDEPECHTHPDPLPFDYVSPFFARHNFH